MSSLDLSPSSSTMNQMASSFFPPSANILLQMQTPSSVVSASAAATLPFEQLLHDHHDHGKYHHHHQPSLSQFLPSPHDRHDLGGMTAMMGNGVGGEEELSDDGSQAGEKKRRLNVEQVRALEKNFEIGNKLEPERKMQLARALGLEPRQIAIWFQNRRARWKTKQLEKDYDVLKRQFDALRSENEALRAQNKKLQAEIMAANGITRTEALAEPINLNKETDQGSCSNRSTTDNNSSGDINLDISRPSPPPTAVPDHHHHQQSNIISRPIFAPFRPPPVSMTQLLHCPKIEHGGGASNEDQSLISNMFCNMEDQSAAFWAWPESHNFH